MTEWLKSDITQLLLGGLGLTLILTFITSLLSLISGIFIGAMRLWGRGWQAKLAAIYIETFRNIPALVLIIFWAFAFPNAFAVEMRQFLFFNNPVINYLSQITGLAIPWYVIAVTIGLSLNTGAYIAELFRAGVGAIAREHTDAAQSMGASWPTIYRVILIPGGLRAAYPAIASRLIHNMKNTALAAFVAVPELFNSVTTAITRTFYATEFLVLAALIYLILALTFSAGLRWLQGYLYPKESRKASVL